MSESLNHDPWCPWDEDAPTSVCQCKLIANVRAEERGRFVVTEYPDGRVRSLIVDGTHWVSVSSANRQENSGVTKALTNLRANVEALPGAHLSGNARGVVYRAAVLALLNGDSDDD